MGRVIEKPLPARATNRHSVMVTGAQLQARLGISYRTLHRMRQSGRGPLAYRIGRQWCYRVEDVESWLARQPQAGGAA